MKVLILVESGVASRYWEGAVPLLPESGVRPLFMTVRGRGPLHAALEGKDIPTATLGCRSSRDYPAAVLEVARIVAKERVDLLHLSEPIPGVIGGVGGILAGRGRRVFHRHHCAMPGVQACLSRVASRCNHLTMGVSRSVLDEAQRGDSVPADRTRLAYNGIERLRPVEAMEVEGLRRRLGIPDGAPVVSIVARLRREKGHQTLFEALPVIQRGLGRVPHVVIPGCGPEESALRERARAFEPGTIHFVGHQEDVAPWFALADVVVMPSHSEPFGLSAVEALASSRPLVASRIDGLAEVVEDGISGLLVTPRDPGALAEGVLRVLRDPGLARGLSAGGYQRFRARFTMKAMVESWLACYEDALAIAGRSSRPAVVQDDLS